ncbi:FAD-dependent monooxygenase [Streptomyces sp. MB09-02B]|uniref:FAD-dependent monooxygenase n=1 Tax=Streptomyces sp. MB09-02B TaxID=3028667 RepID=UPI0029B22157|nr:FAD-dependent monooxygenase [Streptomyces sp. MB09-02B]MDX3639650.1 FAD-dependent monooxygenase [Streptomyces sp. MB09-02B]
MAPKVRITVVGAGIGGLAAALALTRKGHQVRVHEQAPELKEAGVGMHLGPNGSRILQRWGLGERLRASAVRPAAMEVREWSGGTTLVRRPMGEEWLAEFGAPYYTVHRADLHTMLAEALPPGTVRVGHRLERFTDTGEVVRLEFADETTAETDVLIGADGVHSVVRRAVAGPDTAVFSGQSAFRGLIARDQVPGLPGDTLLLWAGPDARLLVYPVRGGRFLTFVAVVPDPHRRLESWSEPGDLDTLDAVFSGWNPDVKSLIAAVRETRRWALYDREPLTRWSHGAVTLLGDAAHPMLPHHGQGVSQAVEDAAVLAHCLDALDGAAPATGATRRRIADALRSYEAVRRPHTTRVQLGSRGGGSQRLRPDEDGKASTGTMSSLVQDVSWIQRHDAEADLPPLPDRPH